MALTRANLRPASRRALLAPVVLLLATLLMLAAGVVDLLTEQGPATSAGDSKLVDIIGGLGLLGFALIGALIVWNKPEHRFGWLYLWIGLGIGIFFFADTWATYRQDAVSGGPPDAVAAAWLANWFGPAILYVVMTWPLLLFPTGYPLTRRWSRLLWVTTAGIALMALGFAFLPGPLGSYESIDNPLGLPGGWQPALEVATGLAALVASVCVLVCALAPIVRLRRARGVQRQQLKWFVWAGALVALSLVAALALVSWNDAEWWAGMCVILGLLAMLAATGIAILRYQLYDIDVIINRTLVYGALSLVLAGVYAVGVVGLQQVFAGYAGGSNLAVAASTLGVAALVRPGRARIQHFVDRRFYRHKYDSTLIIDAFSDRLRDELDLDALTTEIRQVVQETMQPEHVSVWLRETREG